MTGDTFTLDKRASMVNYDNGSTGYITVRLMDENWYGSRRRVKLDKSIVRVWINGHELDKSKLLNTSRGPIFKAPDRAEIDVWAYGRRDDLLGGWGALNLSLSFASAWTIDNDIRYDLIILFNMLCR